MVPRCYPFYDWRGHHLQSVALFTHRLIGRGDRYTLCWILCVPLNVSCVWNDSCVLEYIYTLDIIYLVHEPLPDFSFLSIDVRNPRNWR